MLIYRFQTLQVCGSPVQFGSCDQEKQNLWDPLLKILAQEFWGWGGKLGNLHSRQILRLRSWFRGYNWRESEGLPTLQLSPTSAPHHLRANFKGLRYQNYLASRCTRSVCGYWNSWPSHELNPLQHQNEATSLTPNLSMVVNSFQKLPEIFVTQSACRLLNSLVSE